MEARKIINLMLIVFFSVFSAHPGFAQTPKKPLMISGVDRTAEAADEGAGTAKGSGDEADKKKNENNVTLDFKDADIINVLRILSLKSGVNIVTGPEVSGTVTIRLKDVPWEKALEIVLRTYGYVFEREENIIRVTTKENLQTEELITEAFVLNYSTATEIEDAISEIISERGRIKSVARTNTVIVTDVPTNIYKIGEIIKKLDKRTPQVYIDSKIIRTELGVTENLGIDWNVAGTLSGASRPSTFPFVNDPNTFNLSKFESLNDIISSFSPNQDTTEGTDADSTETGQTDSTSFVGTGIFPAAGEGDFTFGALDFTAFNAVLNLLKSRASTKIVSNPRIVTLNHQQARVQVGSEVGIPTFERNETTGSFEISGFEPRDVGVVLIVTPHVNDTEEILVELIPEVSSFDGFIAIGGTNLATPQFTTTRAATQVLIRNSETIAIGGLLTEAEQGSYDRIPVISEIPILGRLFRSTRQSTTANNKIETLFFITCTIVDTEGQPEVFQNSVSIPLATLAGPAAV